MLVTDFTNNANDTKTPVRYRHDSFFFASVREIGGKLFASVDKAAEVT